MKIKLNAITAAPWNTRGKILPASVSELTRSIAENGLINPITIWKCNSDINHINEWYCIAGNRRLAALKLMHAPNEHLTDLTEGKDFIVFRGTDDEAKLVTVTENLQREDVGPIEEAALVSQCLNAGMTAEAVAAKTGRSASWVNRRRRLIALGEEWKKAAANYTTEQLEKIATYAPEVQERVAKTYAPESAKWEWVKGVLDRESRDLGEAPFSTDACAQCTKRTGCEADLWGVCDGALGKCQDAKCYDRMLKEFTAAKVKKLTKGAEVSRVKYSWQLPSDGVKKPDAEHPCAYVHECNGSIEVRWGKSAKDEREAKEAEKAEREKADAERIATRKREEAVVAKLAEWCENEDSDLEGLVAKYIAPGTPALTAKYIAKIVSEEWNGWMSLADWAEVVRAFDEIPKLVGLADEEHALLKAALKKDDDDDEAGDGEE